jgi:actin
MIESIIIDNGTSTCKAGFSEDDMPRVEIPTVLGFPSSQGGGSGDDQIDVFVGDEALSKGGILELNRPIEKGEIKDFDIMESIWKHIFYNELLSETKSNPVIVSEAPFAPYENKKKMAQILFEKLNVENLYITNTSTLALYANGKTTGIVVDLGYQTSSCVPIYEGFVLNHAVGKIEMGGEDLTNYFTSLINSNKENLTKYNNPAEKSMINDLKEKVCEVAEDYDSQMKKCMDSKAFDFYDLPDKSRVYIGGEKYQCPEMLFQPVMNNTLNQNTGIHEQAYKSIKRCDEDIHKDLYYNVVLCGGSSLFLKIKKRFVKELQSLAPTGKVVNVIAPPERKFSAWLGGAILASLESFRQQMFVSKKDFAEAGENYIYDKFF